MSERGVTTLDLENMRSLVAEVLEVTSAEVADKTDLGEELGADSLALLEIAGDVHKHYGVRIADARAITIKSLLELYELVATEVQR